MSGLVIALRFMPLVALAAMLLTRRRRSARSRGPAGGRAPLVANLAAFASYLVALLVSSGSPDGGTGLLLASTGALLGLAGVALVARSRAELGAAWSLVPRADDAAGLVTTGPYRLVRHPIYLGLTLVAIGESLAFASWPALLVVLAGIVPTFVWRARAEESLLRRAFGERFVAYGRRTSRIIPGILRARR